MVQDSNISEPLNRAFSEWKSKLLQLDRKNRLLYFKTQTEAGKAKTGIVRVACEDLDGLYNSLTDSPEGLKFPYAEKKRKRAVKDELAEDVEPTDSDGASNESEIYIREGDLSVLDCTLLELQKRLRALRKRDKEFEQEQGINILFLAFGFLSWVDEQEKDGLAPLLLLACDLEAESLKDNIRLVAESDDLLINVTLKQKLSTLKYTLPDFDSETDTISTYLDKCESALCKESDWSINRDVYLSTFAYSKIAMWEDLERMNTSGFQTAALQALSGAELVLQTEIERTAITDSANDEDFVGAKLDDELDAAKQFLVLPADYSQILAVEAARSGCHLIIHGPPGTGKSQTIANLIGTFMADGKTVLFVSEKSAALDVVKRRLAKCGLGNFCIDLHGRRAKKEAFYDQLRSSVEDDRQQKDTKFPHHQLSEYRRELNELARALHQTREPLGTSIYRMHGEYAKVRSATDVQLDIQNVEYLPEKLDERKLRKLVEIGDRLSKREKQFKHHADTKWAALKQTAAMVRLSDDVRKWLTTMIEVSDRLSQESRNALQDLDTKPPSCFESMQKLIAFYSIMMECPKVPTHWLSAEALTRLRQVSEEKRGDFEQLQHLQKDVSQYFGKELPPRDFAADHKELESVSAHSKQLAHLLGESWQHRIVSQAGILCQHIEQLETDCSTLATKLQEIATSLGMANPASRQEISKIIELTNKLIEMDPIPGRWYEINTHREIEKSLSTGRSVLESLLSDEKALFEEYNKELVDKIDKQIRVRFIADYDSFLGPILKQKQYIADIRTIQFEHRNAKKPTRQEALWVIEKALNVQKLRSEWKDLDENLSKNLENLFEERDTDWERTSRTFQNAKELLAAHVDPSRLRELLASSTRRKDLKALTDSLQELLTRIDSCTKELNGSGNSFAFDAELSVLTRIIETTKQPLHRTRDTLAAWNLKLDQSTDLMQVSNIASKCASLVELQTQLQQQRKHLTAELLDRYQDDQTNWNEISTALNWTEQYLTSLPLPLSTGVAKEIQNPKAATVYSAILERLKTDSEKLEHVFTKLDALFDINKTPWTAWTMATFDELKAWAEPLIPEADEAPDWIVYRNVCAELDSELGTAAVQRIRSECDSALQIPNIIKRRLISDWLEFVYMHEPVLRNFAVQDQEDLITKFRKLDQHSWPEAAKEEIRRRVYERYPLRQALGEVGSDMPRLRSELSKKKRRLSIRRLLERLPDLVKTLKPCFFMSPLSVSQHLPAIAPGEDPHFDILMFDEASQIFPEDAVPAIARCRQIIVVGDEKQLPPTGFFRSGEDSSWDEYEADEEDDNALVDTESVLSALKRFIGRGVYERYLKVHYRSRHDTLIKFSNFHFYDKKLLIFPSPSRTVDELGLSDVFVPDGRFDSGGSRTNRKEAERVVDLVFEHMRNTRDDETLGVVTLSAAQAELIDNLINLRKQTEADIAYRFSEGHHEEFFVKNLEKVQGDERDHIILCIAYGPTVATGKFMNRFGPINTPMGARRLNVAITRARKKLTLVRSLHASDITSESTGARLLKQFIEYAQDPVRHFEKQVSASADAEPDSSFEVAVKDALEGKGYKVQPQVGVSGYRIDLAIVSDDGLFYDLGIECDGINYHSSPAARDRDWLRQQILEDLGWDIHRIWSTSWIRSPEQELARIEAALEIAKKKRVRPSVPV